METDAKNSIKINFIIIPFILEYYLRPPPDLRLPPPLDLEPDERDPPLDFRTPELRELEPLDLRTPELRELEPLDLRTPELRELEPLDLRTPEPRELEPLDLRTSLDFEEPRVFLVVGLTVFVVFTTLEFEFLVFTTLEFLLVLDLELPTD